MTSLLPGRGAAGPDEETIRLERRLFEKRRRWGRHGRMRRVLLALVVALVLAAGAYAVGWSSLLAVDRVQVGGTSVLTPDAVRSAAGVPMGTPLVRVDLDAVRARVDRLPAVRSARVSRAWPHGVRIEVTERTAVAVVPRGGGFRGLAADGVLFRSYSLRPKGLPVVQSAQGADTRALREAAAVVGALDPDLLRRVDHVSVASADGIRLVLRSGRQVVWGTAAQSREKAEVLAALMGQRASVIDVRVPGRPTTRP